MAKPTDVTQLLLWSDDELPATQDPSQDEEPDVPHNEYSIAPKLSAAAQWFLPGFEPEDA